MLKLESQQFYTNVDLVAQAIFVKTMNKAYPEVDIIGEEDLNNETSRPILLNGKLIIEEYSRNHELQKRLEDNLYTIIKESKNSNISKEEEVFRQKEHKNFEKLINKRKVKILLDPLDATHSFINKQYHESTILAGVLVNNNPYIGSVTSPFYQFDKENTGVVSYFNIPIYGLFALKKQKSKLFDNVHNYKIDQVKSTKRNSYQNKIYPSKNYCPNTDLKLIVSRWKYEKLSQILKPLVNDKIIKSLNMKIHNGMGYRSIKMIEEGYYFMTIQSTMGFWDICATDALFREIGGGCLNLMGSEIDYSGATSREVSKFDIMIGDNQAELNNYLMHYNELISKRVRIA